MKTIVCDSKYAENDIVDFPEELIRDHYCLYVAAREGQAIRSLNKNVPACGWWALKSEGLMDDSGHIIPEAFKDYEVIVFANPNRVWEPMRELYKKLISKVQSL
jgi:hypothetical protein